MAKPTIETRLQRKFILMTADNSMAESVLSAMDDDWGECQVITDLDDIGDWHEILLYRFIVMDLNEVEAFDPLDVIRQIRSEYQINNPVFCFGGDDDIIDEMRYSRADRFFTREEMIEMIPTFCHQYRW